MSYTPVLKSKISTVNSSTATLAGDAVFTGTAEDITNYASISVTYTSDVASADSGLSMEFSPDGTNWDRKLIGSLIGKTSETHVLRKISKFFRIVYTNGTSAQSSFRLQSVLDVSANLPLINRTGQPQGVNNVIPVRQFSAIDLDFARKHVVGGRAFFFFGSNDGVGTSFEDIHPNGGDINWLETATKVEVLSSDVADTSAGLGVRQVEIHGLSATGADQDEVITMNGTSAVESSLTYIRVNKMHNENVGTYGGSHKGDITCRVTGGGVTLSIMKGKEGSVDTSVQYGSGEANNGYWSVPLGKVLYITDIKIQVSNAGNKEADIILYEREGILDTSAPMDPRRIIFGIQGVQGGASKSFKSHIKIKQLTDIWFRAKSTDAGGLPIAVSLDFYLLDRDSSGA